MRRSMLGSLFISLLLGSGSLGAQTSDDPVERGRYLAHGVAMCVECHSPRDDSGHLIETRLFRGAPIPVPAPRRSPREWAFAAPNVAGLPGYTDEDAIRLLTKGITPKGRPPRAPMPLFRMSEDDAAAIVAYLRSRR